MMVYLSLVIRDMLNKSHLRFIHSFIWKIDIMSFKKLTERCSQTNHGEKDRFYAACRAKACYALVAIESIREVNSR